MRAELEFESLTGGGPISLVGSIGDPDVGASGYVETELSVAGTACSYRSTTSTFPRDGRLELVEGPSAPFRVRIVVRRPRSASDCSGVVLLEWLNVSSGADAAASYGFVAPEILRRGHVWVGVSAQRAGIDSAPALVEVDGVGLVGLREADPARYGSLRHPGDAHSYDIFSQVAAALRDRSARGPTADLHEVSVLALGESQSAYALSTYLDGVQPVRQLLDGALIHGRGAPIAPLDGPDGRFDLDAGRSDPPVRLRDDLEVPVLLVQTETDVLGHLAYVRARQPDSERFRLWEVAGSAHADRSLVGELEPLLGCPGPVNRGQQRFVLRAALRSLVEWSAGRRVPPSAERLAVLDDDGGASDGGASDGGAAGVSVPGHRFELDGLGNVVGGVRTPCVDEPVQVLSGLPAPGSNRVCRLFGRTSAIPAHLLGDRYGSAAGYLDRYRAATDRAIAAGFVLAEDRDEVLGDARPELIGW